MRFRATALDRYVRGIFVGAMGVCMVVFVAMWIVGDLANKIDDILEAMKEDDANTTGTMIGLVGRYFATNLPFFLHHTAPFIPLIAALYTLNRLLRANELTPMVVAGNSLFRALRPIFVSTGLFALLVFAQQEFVLPKLAIEQEHLGRRIRGKSTREYTELQVIADRAGNRYVIDRYDPLETRRRITRLQLTRTETAPNGELVLTRRVIAAGATYRDEDDGPRGWALDDGAIDDRRLPDGTIVRRRIDFLSRDDAPLRPKDIERSVANTPARSLATLRREMRRAPSRDIALEIHRHFTHPAKALLLLFLGLPFFMRAYLRQLTPGPILKSFGVCAAFYLVDFLCLDLGSETRATLSPAVAAWLPIVSFSVIAAWLLDHVRT